MESYLRTEPDILFSNSGSVPTEALLSGLPPGGLGGAIAVQCQPCQRRDTIDRRVMVFSKILNHCQGKLLQGRGASSETQVYRNITYASGIVGFHDRGNTALLCRVCFLSGTACRWGFTRGPCGWLTDFSPFTSMGAPQGTYGSVRRPSRGSCNDDTIRKLQNSKIFKRNKSFCAAYAPQSSSHTPGA